MSSQEGPQEGEIRQVGKERWGRGWEVVVYEQCWPYSSSNGLNPEGPQGVALSLVRARGKSVGHERGVSKVSLVS